MAKFIEGVVDFEDYTQIMVNLDKFDIQEITTQSKNNKTEVTFTVTEADVNSEPMNITINVNQLNGQAYFEHDGTESVYIK